MKHYFTFASFLLLSLGLKAQEHTITLTPKPDSITLYLSGAELKYTENVPLKKGKNIVILSHLAAGIKPLSALVKVTGKAELLSVSAQNSYLPQYNTLNTPLKWQDSIERITEKIQDINDQLDAWAAEKNVLAHNQSLNGDNTLLSITELQKAAEYYRNRNLQIGQSINELNKKKMQLVAQLDRLQNQSKELQEPNSTEEKSVVIILEAATDESVQIFFRYLTDKAGWLATYDLIASEVSQSILLKYKARIYNHTGIPWENVKLKLSTADPSQGAAKPTLTPWTLNYGREQEMDEVYDKEGYTEKKSVGKPYLKSIDIIMAPVNMISVNELNTEFTIDKTYTIPAIRKPYIIEVTRYSIQAVFEHYAIPKVDKDVFLVARIGDWEKLNLIDGKANIYFGDNYAGESTINTRLVEDTLELSFGRDNQVLATRAKREEFSSKKLVGAFRTETFTYEIVVKNNRNTTIKVNVLDQVPVPLESDITVTAIETSGATPDQLGKLQWIKELAPGQTIKVNLSFSVKCPKNKLPNMAKIKLTPRYL